jgi:hypothetical protein
VNVVILCSSRRQHTASRHTARLSLRNDRDGALVPSRRHRAVHGKVIVVANRQVALGSSLCASPRLAH